MTAVSFQRRRAGALLLGTVAALCVLLPALRSAESVEELAAKIKSGFLLNFARYVEWPQSSFANSNSPVVIGVLSQAQDPLGTFLDKTVEGKTVERRAVIVKRGRRVSELLDCHVVFVSASEQGRLRRILQELQDKPVLTVSDMEGFTDAGGIILLKKKQGVMRFDINREAADRAGLKVSSKLLKLADNLKQKE